MFKDNRGLVEDVVSLRNQLLLTEQNLQSLGEQLRWCIRSQWAVVLFDLTETIWYAFQIQDCMSYWFVCYAHWIALVDTCFSHSGNDIIGEDNDRSRAYEFPGGLTLEDLHKPERYPHPDRTTQQRECVSISTCDCTVRNKRCCVMKRKSVMLRCCGRQMSSWFVLIINLPSIVTMGD